MMTDAPVRFSSDESPTCDLCILNEEKASWHCPTCNEYMCYPCYTTHSLLVDDHIPYIKFNEEQSRLEDEMLRELSKGILYRDVCERKQSNQIGDGNNKMSHDQIPDTSNDSSKGTMAILQGEESGIKQQRERNVKGIDKALHNQVLDTSYESSRGNIEMLQGEESGIKHQRERNVKGIDKTLQDQEPGRRNISDQNRKKSKEILHNGEVSGRKQRSDESLQESETGNSGILHGEVSGRKQCSDATSMERSKGNSRMLHGEVPGRKWGSDEILKESSKGNSWMLHGEVPGRKWGSDEILKESSKGNSRMLHDEVHVRKHGHDGELKGNNDQVPGRKNTTDKLRKGNKVKNKGKVYNELATDDSYMRVEGTLGTNRSCPSAPSSSSHSTFSSASIKCQFNASQDDDDKPCYITGVLVMNNLILIADYHNHKIKAFDRHDCSFVFHSHVENAFGLTEISTDTIAVTGKSISGSFFTLFALNDFGFEKIRKVSTPNWCWGLRHHDGLIYVVCHDKEKDVYEVDVFTVAGKHKRSFMPLLDGQEVLLRPTGIAIHHETETLYIGDWFTSTVVGLSLSGKVLFNQMPQHCEDVSGVAVDDQGQLYVCGTASNNVIGMSADGVTSEVLVRENIKWPQCLHVHGDELILCCNRSFIVRIYQLS